MISVIVRARVEQLLWLLYSPPTPHYSVLRGPTSQNQPNIADWYNSTIV